MNKALATVRIAGPADWEEIFRLIRQGHEENGLFPLDIEKVSWYLVRMLNPEVIHPLDTGPRGVIGVIGEPEHLEGIAWIMIDCLPYTSKKHLAELIVYVDPKYRREGHHRALIEWMKLQSLMSGLVLLSGILSREARTEAKVRLYERTLPKAGAFFCFDPIVASSSIAAASMMH